MFGARVTRYGRIVGLVGYIGGGARMEAYDIDIALSLRWYQCVVYRTK